MSGSGEPHHLMATAEALRAATASGDVSHIGAVLAADVQWFGSRGGVCWNRDDVVGVLGAFFEQPIPPQVTEVVAVGDGLVVEVALDDDGERAQWVAALLVDDGGRITRIQDYESKAAAQHDLAALARARAVASDRPVAAVVGLVPFVHVADVSRSIAFYERLGMHVQSRYEPDGRTVWAFLESVESDAAALMVAEADEPVDQREQALLFYLYTHDLLRLRAHLLDGGILPGEILDGSPGPKREMRVTDPDGYCLMIAQIDDDTAV